MAKRLTKRLTKRGPGRPPAAMERFSRDMFEGLLEIGATQVEVQRVMKISEASLTRAIKQEYGKSVNFEDMAKLKRDTVKMSLRRRVLKGALGGDKTLLIFASKAYAGLSDRVVVKRDEEQFEEEQNRADQRAAMGAMTALAIESQRLDRLQAILQGALKGPSGNSRQKALPPAAEDD